MEKKETKKKEFEIADVTIGEFLSKETIDTLYKMTKKKVKKKNKR